MSDDDLSDVLMFFKRPKEAKPIAAESSSEVPARGAKLMEGFMPGHYFEVQDFRFGIALADDEGGGKALQEDQRSYNRWRGLSGTDVPDPPFKAEPRDVTIERKIDASSPVLLQHCLNTEKFEQAVLVKRARIGSGGAMAVVLRMEFSDVWIRSIEWEDGDAVEESCSFKFGAVKVIYVSRGPDGSENGTSVNCNWSSTDG